MSTRHLLGCSALKTVMSVVVLWAIVCSVLGSAALANEHNDETWILENLIKNGGFEHLAGGVPTDWDRYASRGSRDGFVVSTMARTGQYSLLFDVNKAVELGNSNVARLILGQTLDTSAGQPGKHYRFSIYYKTEGDPLGRLMIQGFPGGDLWATFGPAEEWTRVEMNFVWPEDEASFKFQVWARDAAAGKLWIDDVEVVPLDEEVDQRNQSMFFLHPGGQWMGGGKWTQNECKVEDTCLEISTSTDRGYQMLTVPVEEGKRYAAQVWVRTEDVRAWQGRESRGAVIFAQWADHNGQHVVGGTFPYGLFGTNEWTQIHVPFGSPIPANVGFIQLLIGIEGMGTAWFEGEVDFWELSPSGELKTLSQPSEDPVPDFVLKEAGAVIEIESINYEQHPRLLASEEDFARIRRLIEDKDRLAVGWYASLTSRANEILGSSVSTYEIPDGLRLLETSRQVRDRAEILALIYRLTDDERYLLRLWAELEAAAAFPDWNPQHFLDTAEMTRAFATAYDWLYDQWTEDQRRLLREAIVEKGLMPALELYRSSTSWVRDTSNWNLVCNGGIVMGALAVAEHFPALADEIVRSSVPSVQNALKGFAPDGGWDEGIVYWHYAIRYLIPYLASLESALGTDYGLAELPGISDAGYFPMYLAGPMGQVFNFGDADRGLVEGPELLWLANRFNNADFATWQLARGTTTSPQWSLLWYAQEMTKGSDPMQWPLDRYFRDVEVVTLRSEWNNRDASFVGFKAGSNDHTHGDLDLGSFVFDALGQRWVEELGADDYNLPGYAQYHITGERWTYYRKRAEGQNTLVINPGLGPDQNIRGAGSVTYLSSKPEEAVAILDLTAAYVDHVHSAKRGFALFDERRQLLIQDEILAPEPIELWWFVHTTATIDLSADGTEAVLQKGDQRLIARILAPTDARFTVMAAEPLPTSPNPSGQVQNHGVRKLATHLSQVVNPRLVVQFTPLEPNEEAPIVPTVLPLLEWEQANEMTPLWSGLSRMYVRIPALEGADPVHGRIPFQLELRADEPLEIEEVKVYLDDEVIYHGSEVPADLILDTAKWVDGEHLVSLWLSLSEGAPISRKIPLHIKNSWSLTDEQEPPIESAFLGTISRAKTKSTSGGWTYETDKASAFFGDANRRVPTGNTAEYLIWETPALDEFRLTMYAPIADLNHILSLAVSLDGDQWSQVPYCVEIKDGVENNLWLEVTGSIPDDVSTQWFRLTLESSEVQVGRVKFVGTIR